MQNDDSDLSLLIEDEDLGWCDRLCRGLVSILIVFLNIIQFLISVLVFIVQRVVDEVIATEHMFLLMTNLYAFMCQFFFFTLCDITLLKPEHKHKRGKVISGLTTLLLYSIFTYFASKIRDTFYLAVERYNQPVTRRTYILRFIKILLEFIKAAIVILCLREQGLQYHFDPKYSSATFIYYICTEKLFVEGIIWGSKLLSLAMLDGLEHLYIPIILHGISIFLTVIVLSILIAMRKYTLYAVLSSYFTLYLPLKNMIWNYLVPLIVEQRTFASFKIANERDLLEWDDICAVCLERMSRARITPCNHLFHPQCLKRCLQTSMQCPLCKNDFISAYQENGAHNSRRIENGQ